MEWTKKGIVLDVKDIKTNWAASHIQMPTLYRINNDVIRIYLSVRNKDCKSHPIYVEIDSHNYNMISWHTEPLLELGAVGTFDDCGIMFSSCIDFNEKMYMYYVGWNQEKVLPYRTSIGLAVSMDGGRTFQKASTGPVMDRDFESPYFNTTPFVVKEENRLRMWYTYCTEWQYDQQDGYVPAYLIKSATSDDGIHWTREKDDCIKYKNIHEAIARPYMIKCNNKYYMWYSYRDTKDFRKNKNNAYMIGMAVSEDGREWKRRDEYVGIQKSESGWDSEMMCYPSVIENGDELVMFYNGNEHGKYAFGYATCKKADLVTEI